MTAPDPAVALPTDVGRVVWGELSPRERLRDVLIACTLIGGAIFLQLQLAGGGALFARDFWLDEVLTCKIVSDPDFFHSMRAVQAGIDLSPPGFQVLLRGWAMVFGVSETSLRSFAFATMMVALASVYLLLRRSANRLVCCAAVLALWSHPVILQEAFDARFYTPWLAAIVWYCLFWQMAMQRDGGSWACAGLALCSFLVCSFHYFGIISLALVVAGELLIRRPTWSAVRPLLIASLTGPLALGFYIPVFLVQQRAISPVTWVPDADLTHVSQFVVKLLFPAQLVAVLLVALVTPWLQRDERSDDGLDLRTSVDSSSGLISLTAMIPLLLVISYLWQSITIARYAFPAVACIAPAVVIGMRGLHRFAAFALIVIFSIAGCYGLLSLKQSSQSDSKKFRDLMALIEQHTSTQSVFFESFSYCLVGCHYAPHLKERCFHINFQPGELPVSDRLRWRVFGRDHTIALTKFYPLPGNYPWSKLRKAPAFFLVLEESELPPPRTLPAELYPGFTGRRIEGRLYLMTRVAAPTAKTQP